VAAINIAVPIFTASGTTRSDQATAQIQRLIPDGPLVLCQCLLATACRKAVRSPRMHSPK